MKQHLQELFENAKSTSRSNIDVDLKASGVQQFQNAQIRSQSFVQNIEDMKYVSSATILSSCQEISKDDAEVDKNIHDNLVDVLTCSTILLIVYFETS